MTQQEAIQAFFNQKPIQFGDCSISRNPIPLKRIFEIAWRIHEDGSHSFVVGGMDYNGNSVIHGLPEQFTLDCEGG